MERRWSTVVGESGTGQRLDVFLSTQQGLGLSRNRVQGLIDEGEVLVNGKKPKASLRLEGGERISVSLPPPATWSIGPEDIPLRVMYEDDDIIVVDKPRGLVVHPAAGHRSGTLVNALVSYCPDLVGVGGVQRPGLVHRLDKDTSGLMVVAKNDRALMSLSAQIKDRLTLKEYLALVVGRPEPPKGTINAPIGRHPTNRKKMAVTSGGRPAVTQYRVTEGCRDYSLLRLVLETGRTHQIRVHLAHIGVPVVGDPVYGGRVASALYDRGQALHATRLAFRHPGTGDWAEFVSPLPPDLVELWHALCPTPDAVPPSR